MRNNAPITNGETKVIAAAAAISLIGITLLVWLLSVKLIGETVFAGLFVVLLLTGLFITFSNRVELFSLKELSIKFAQVEGARNEVEAREKSIQKIALLLGEITLFTSVTDGMSFPKETRELRREWYKSKVTELLDLISACPEDRKNVFKFIDKFKATYFDDHFDAEHTEEGWVEFWAMASADINENKKPN